MAIETAADRAAFVDPDAFGIAATYTAAGGGSAVLTGVLDEPFLAVSAGAVAVAETRPTFLCRSADLPAGAAGGESGDTLTIGSVTWTVVELQPDGTGMTLVVLGR